MKISLVSESETYPFEVSEDIEVENFKVLCEVETGIPVSDILLIFNGAPLTNVKQTLKEYGLKDNDLLMLVHVSRMRQAMSQAIRASNPMPQAMRRSVPTNVNQFDFGSIQIPGSSSQNSSTKNSPSSPSASKNFVEDTDQLLKDQGDPAVIRDMILANPGQLTVLKQNNPALAEALTSDDPTKFERVLKEQQTDQREHEQKRLKLINADPFDLEAQKIIAEEIKQENINDNMHAAIEYNPEIFGSVHMLYINCFLNGHPVKAFVDSGAQTTIVSKSCADRCNIMRLSDKRFAGIAKGVGTQKILGRVHMGQIQIEKDFLASSFCILEEQPMDLLIGLDMLKRHQMSIDLKSNELIIGTTGTRTPFLPESELPDCGRLSFAAEEEALMQSETAAEDQALAQAISHSISDS